jgi:hypothetical protein
VVVEISSQAREAMAESIGVMRDGQRSYVHIEVASYCDENIASA